MVNLEIICLFGDLYLAFYCFTFCCVIYGKFSVVVTLFDIQ